jgi:hypothetical protein
MRVVVPASTQLGASAAEYVFGDDVPALLA